MSLKQTVQQWADTFFANLKQSYAGRPLILIVINHIQAQVDAEIPVLIAQGIPTVAAGLKSLVDTTFLRLETDTKSLPFLAGVLEGLNAWIDVEIDKLAQQLNAQVVTGV